MNALGDAPRLPAPPSASRMPGDDDELDLRRLVDQLWGGRWIVVGSIVVALLAACLYLMAARPVFVATGLVQVEEDESGLSQSMDDLSSLFEGGAKTSAELEILKSRMVLSKVINELKLEIQAEPQYFPIIGRFWARLNPGVAPEKLWGRGYAWGGERIEVSTFNVPDSLRGEEFTLVATQAGYRLLGPEGDTIVEGAVGALVEGKLPGGVVQIFVKDLHAVPGCRFTVVRTTEQFAYKDLADRFQVTEQGRQSGIIQLSLEGYSPTQAAAIVRHVEDVYVRQNVERRSAEAKQSLEFLQEQLPDIKKEVDSAQAQLNAYQVQQDSVDVTKETELILQQSVELETRRLELQQQRQQALQRFTAKHPVVIAIDAQLAGIARETGNIKQQSETLPAKQQEILSLLRDLEVNSQIYTSLLNSSQELQVAKAGTVGNVRIIDYPFVPQIKSRPRAALVLALSLVLGAIAGVAITLLRLALNRGVSDPAQVELALGLASYAAIPYSRVQGKIRHKIKRGREGAFILASLDSTDVAVEALRSLRTSLQFAMLESRNNVLMLTGPTPGVGKSFVSINLGAVLAASGKKVAVIDADLRKGILHRYAGHQQSPGITDFILGRVEAHQIVCKTQVGDLSLIPRGTAAPNPAELLLHPRFTELVGTLSRYHDIVILDAPPVLPVTDACVIGALAGCTLLVLKDREHPMPAIEDTLRRLQHAGVNPKGIVFNQMGRTPGSYYGYGTYGAYRYDSKYA